MEQLTRRERVRRAMHYQPVDKVPVRYYYCPVGYYEHGDKLNDLYARLPGDFAPYKRYPIPGPGENDFDESGEYHAFQTDEWGVTWEHRIFGITGIPCSYPIRNQEEAELYRTPTPVPCHGPDFDAFVQQITLCKEQDYPAMVHCGNLYERLIALYGDENVLCDIVMDEVGINKLADRIIEYNKALVTRAVKAGADILSFGDDYGTERSLIIGERTWRSFFKPRLKELFQPAVDAGLDIHFHSCGQISQILPDLQEIGVKSIWPQLPAYNMEELARHCRELGLAVEVHTDRARTMTYGTPEQVKELVNREFETFRMMDGGAWFYIEADNGFPFANLEALVEAVSEYR